MGVSESWFVEHALAARRRAAEVRSPGLRRHLLSVAVQFEFDAFLVQQSYAAIAESRQLIKQRGQSAGLMRASVSLAVEVAMLNKILAASAMTMIVALASCELFAQGSSPNLGGTWRCAPDPSSCQGGQTFTVTQSGDNLDIKNDRGDVGHAQLTSNISLSASPPWNMLGVILPDGAIQWSNGTKWQKQ